MIKALERFEDSYIPEPMSGCWLWVATCNPAGYGRFWFDGKNKLAHRWFYEQTNGSIADSLPLDHLCRVRCCVNPAHLEPVTYRENALRGESFSAVNAQKTHCINGHLLDGENLYIDLSRGPVERRCKECRKLRMRAKRARPQPANTGEVVLRRCGVNPPSSAGKILE